MRTSIFTVVLCVAGIVGLAQDAQAGRKNIPTLIQVTNNTEGDIFDPRLRSEGAETIVFGSDGDVMGSGTATPQKEVYFWDRTIRQVSRVTTSSIGDSISGSRSTDRTFNGGRPEYVAFVSTDDFDPSVGNADGNPEVFLWERLSGAFHQLTDTLAPVVNADPYPSDSGTCIVFSSNGDMADNDGTDPNHPTTSWTNPDGSQEIFMYKLRSADDFPRDGNFTQVSNGPTGSVSSAPVTGGYIYQRQCDVTAYLSDHDQVGMGVVGTHMYRYKRGQAEVTYMVDKKMSLGLPPPGIYGKPHISSASLVARGPAIVFASSADLWLNGSSGMNLFKYRNLHLRMRQFSDLDLGDIFNPVVSDGNGKVVYASNGENIDPDKRIKRGGLPPFNADGNKEIFLIKGRRRVQQITRTAGCENGQASIDFLGRSFAFRSSCDLIPGRNPNNVPQVFFYTIEPEDDLLAPGGCLISEGCCSSQDGCFERIEGSQFKVSRKRCLQKAKGCD